MTNIGQINIRKHSVPLVHKMHLNDYFYAITGTFWPPKFTEKVSIISVPFIHSSEAPLVLE